MTAVLGLSRRLIVRRPLPVVAPDLDAADSAIRTSSLQSIGGAALAMMCLAPSGVFIPRTFEVADSAPVSWFYGLASLLLLLGAIYSWFGVKARSRRVRPGVNP
ncbi:hypothetical protein ACQPYK_13390 [Streptosporangium sp. CA-135522]|uniref:hypothetical protein n=1 Tax=Streptosporangium sp. CA-135522 TaxID=3240072 RepID=UPI003D949E3F